MPGAIEAVHTTCARGLWSTCCLLLYVLPHVYSHTACTAIHGDTGIAIHGACTAIHNASPLLCSAAVVSLLLCEGFTPCQREDRRASSKGMASPCSAWPSAEMARPLHLGLGTILYGKARTHMHTPEDCDRTVLVPCSVA